MILTLKQIWYNKAWSWCGGMPDFDSSNKYKHRLTVEKDSKKVIAINRSR